MPLLVGIVAALSVLGAVAGFVARAARQAIGFAGAGLGGLGCLLALLALLLDAAPASLDFPIGLPGYPLRLTLDPLAAFFLLPAFLTGTAGIAFAAEVGASAPRASLAGLCWCLAGTVLTLLAEDGATQAIGLCLAGGAIWASGEAGRPRALQLGATVLAALCVLAAKAVPDRPIAVFGLAAIAAGALAGLPPFHRWSIQAHRAAPSRAAALLSGAMQPLAVYLAIRMVLGRSDQPLAWYWAMPLLVAGAVAMFQGAWRAAQETDVDACLAALAERQGGLVATGIGLVLIGRAVDLPGMTVLAEEAVFLLVLTQAVCGTLGQLAAGAVRDGAGSGRLQALGGLIHTMPTVAIGMAATLFALSAAPAGAGFAALWLLFQALLAAPRALAFAPVAVVLAVSAGLSGAAALRLFGVAFLGRPRIPRSAGATDVAKPARPALLVLAGFAVLLGLFPGLAALLAGGAIRQLDAIDLGDRVGVLGLEGYPVLPQVLLTVVLAGLVWLALRRGNGPAPRFGSAWNDGFAPAPPWLPFGDPLTQWSGAGLLPRLPRLPVRWLRHWPKSWSTQHAAMQALLGALAAFLATLLWLGAA